MSACPMQTFNNMTRDAWTCVQTAAAKYGVTGGDSGLASVDGYTVAWSYAEGTGTLHIQCTDSPWYIPCSAITSHITEVVEQCLNDHKIEMTHMVPG